MKDLIDERNEKERMHNSIVKFWNVNYIPRTKEEQEMEKAEEILQRLEAEAEESEAKKQAQIEAALREVAEQEENYNETTGSYSGSYGLNADQVDNVTKGQIDQILMEKTNQLRSIIAQEGGDPS
ncbi:MAG: hypothetical protein ACI4AD_06215 [Roseburia sp.]